MFQLRAANRHATARPDEEGRLAQDEMSALSAASPNALIGGDAALRFPVPKALDNGQRPPRKLLAAVARRLVLALKRP